MSRSNALHRALHRVGLVVVAGALLGCASAGRAVADIHQALAEYYQYRFHSGLPGNCYGVSADGQVGPDGATQMAIPVAYTPSRGNFAISANVGMSDRGLRGLRLRSHGSGVNGTLNLGAGMGPPGRGFYAAYMMTGKNQHSLPGEPAYNLQWQLSSGADGKPAIAIGALDICNQRPATLARPLAGDARSVYAVATMPCADDTGRPVYITAGLGTGRFRGLFAGLSCHLDERTCVFAEYDSLGVNVGASYGIYGADKRDNAVLFLGIADAGFCSYGLTYTHRGR